MSKWFEILLALLVVGAVFAFVFAYLAGLS